MPRSTAILLVGYQRPELILKSIEKLSSLSDLDIVVSIDGPKTADSKNSVEWKSIASIFPSAVWRLRESNLGLAKHIFIAISEVLDEFDNCIVLEDDVQVEIGPLLATKELLDSRLPEKILTVGLFGGLPALPILSRFLSNRWRSTKYFSAWGWGVQREDWRHFDLAIASRYEKELDQLIRSHLGRRRLSIWKRRFRIVAENPSFTWDYQFFLYSIILNKRHVLPTFRTCENIGFDDLRSTNTRDALPSWYRGARSEPILQGSARSEKSPISFLLQFIDSLTWAGDQPLVQKSRELRRRLFLK